MDGVSWIAIGVMAAFGLGIFLYVKFVVNKPKEYKPMTAKQKAAMKHAAKYGVKQKQNKLEYDDDGEGDSL